MRIAICTLVALLPTVLASGSENWPQFRVTKVVEPSRKYTLLASNRLDGECMAFPAAIGNALFLRTGTHLYRIQKQ